MYLQSWRVIKCFLVADCLNWSLPFLLPRFPLMSTFKHKYEYCCCTEDIAFTCKYRHTLTYYLLSFLTDLGSGKYLHSSKPSSWLVCVDMYRTCTVLSFTFSVAIILAIQKLSIFLEPVPLLVFSVLFLPLWHFLFPSRQQTYRTTRAVPVNNWGFTAVLWNVY